MLRDAPTAADGQRAAPDAADTDRGEARGHDQYADQQVLVLDDAGMHFDGLKSFYAECVLGIRPQRATTTASLRCCVQYRSWHHALREFRRHAGPRHRARPRHSRFAPGTAAVFCAATYRQASPGSPKGCGHVPLRLHAGRPAAIAPRSTPRSSAASTPTTLSAASQTTRASLQTLFPTATSTSKPLPGEGPHHLRRGIHDDRHREQLVPRHR